MKTHLKGLWYYDWVNHYKSVWCWIWGDSMSDEYFNILLTTNRNDRVTCKRCIIYLKLNEK